MVYIVGKKITLNKSRFLFKHKPISSNLTAPETDKFKTGSKSQQFAPKSAGFLWPSAPSAWILQNEKKKKRRIFGESLIWFMYII